MTLYLLKSVKNWRSYDTFKFKAQTINRKRGSNFLIVLPSGRAGKINWNRPIICQNWSFNGGDMTILDFSKNQYSKNVEVQPHSYKNRSWRSSINFLNFCAILTGNRSVIYCGLESKRFLAIQLSIAPPQSGK